jgi:hypothetical protein
MGDRSDDMIKMIKMMMEVVAAVAGRERSW